MKKFLVFFSIFFLILSTSFIKNSTKDIDDEIYSIKERLLSLENRYKKAKLEFDYLSSPEKLMEFQILYMENILKKKSLNEIKKLSFSNKQISISDLTIVD